MDFKAKDVMNSKVISVGLGTKLKKAISLMFENGISGLPVIDLEGKLVGIITESDIVEYSRKKHIVTMRDTLGWVSPYENPDRMYKHEEGIKLLEITKVEDIMTKKVITVNLEDSAAEVAKIMKKKRINHVPVVDDGNKLMGIIARGDIINYLASI